MKFRSLWIAGLATFLALSSRPARPADETPAFAKKFPGGLLTSDYGIITEEDLKLEAWETTTPPFNLNEDSSGYFRWQCFLIRNIKPKIRTWRGEDGRGYANVMVPMCDLNIWVTEKAQQIQVFSGRRALNGEWCQDFMKNWKRLTTGQKHICISGGYNGINEPSKNYPSTPYKSWTWDRIKSKKGCYAYFGGTDCK